MQCLFFFFLNLFFNWKKIALQCYVGFYCTTTKVRLLMLWLRICILLLLVFFLLVRFCLRPNPVSLGPKSTLYLQGVVIGQLLSHVQLFCDAIDCSPLDSIVRGISQARLLELGAISFSRGSSHLGIESRSPALAGRFFTTEPPGKSHLQ